MGTRLLSYSEVETALSCWAKWDFRYGGRLAGDCLDSRVTAPILSEGSAWGAGVAAWHAAGLEALARLNAHAALQDSITADQRRQRDAGMFVDEAVALEMVEKMGAMLDHYMDTAEQLPNLTKLEQEIRVPVPSRSGRRGSSKYQFLCYLDGFTTKANGETWLVEFKLRKSLSGIQHVQQSRQIRWYTWAHSVEAGSAPTGVYVDERLNEVPKAPRVLKDGSVSHAKDQITTGEQYVTACLSNDQEPKPEVVAHLDVRQWQQRIPLMFSPREVEEAGAELTSAAKLIRDLDSGELAPVRNSTIMNCRGCFFRDVCPNPQDRMAVDAAYTRKPPKRDRDAVNVVRGQ